MTTDQPGRPIQGVTLYSFTRVFHQHRYSFEDLVRTVAERKLGPGVEIVGFQAIKGFPDVPPEFVSRFRGLMDETGLVPSAFGANADSLLRRDRALTNDEMVDYMAAQLQVAHDLGFRTIRVQYGVTPDDMERLLPIAERLDLTMGMEIHTPHSVHHPLMEALLERYEKLGSPHLGFIPDWGVSMVAIPNVVLDMYRAQGVPEALLDQVHRRWAEVHRGGALTSAAAIASIRAEFRDMALSAGQSEEIANNLATHGGGMFGHQPASVWGEIMPWVVHSHGKFYEIDERGDEPSVPVKEILRQFVDSGYRRFISSEYEGFHFNTVSDPFDVIAAVQELQRRVVRELGSSMVVDAAEVPSPAVI